MDNFIGEIRIFSYNKVPAGWMPCNGQTLQILQYQALYSLILTYYGGDAKTTFMLPNLNGRTIVGLGRGSTGTEYYPVGMSGGAETITLTLSNTPVHTHYIYANESYDAFPPGAHYLGNPNTPTSSTQTAKNTANANLYNNGSNQQKMTTLPANTITSEGAGQGHENRMPYMPLVYCIATQGTYPPRS